MNDILPKISEIVFAFKNPTWIKVGDKVKCIEHKKNSILKNNQIYSVSDNRYCLSLMEYPSNTFYHIRFKKVEN